MFIAVMIYAPDIIGGSTTRIGSPFVSVALIAGNPAGVCGRFGRCERNNGHDFYDFCGTCFGL